MLDWIYDALDSPETFLQRLFFVIAIIPVIVLICLWAIVLLIADIPIWIFTGKHVFSYWFS